MIPILSKLSTSISEMPPKSISGWNAVTTAGAVIGLVGSLAAIVFFVAPLKTLPSDFREVQNDVAAVQKDVAVQAETIRVLTQATQQIATIIEETSELKSCSARHDVEIRAIRERLQRVETKLP